MAKKQDLDGIIAGIRDIMPPPLNDKKQLKQPVTEFSPKAAGNGVKKPDLRFVEARKSEKINCHPLGKVIFEKNYREGLIRRIEIKSWGTEFDFYEDFINKGRLYFNYYEKKAEYTPFFSFTPQYGHFNQRQLDYYSLWRENVRQGKYIKTDFSYVLLFIYEIINLTPELVSPKDGRRYLAGVWKNYREQFFPLDKYLSEWMADYCLIHGLACPHSEIDGFLDDILKKTTLPEFYLNRLPISEGRAILLRCLSGYDYKSSRQVDEGNHHVFDKHVNSALAKMVEREQEEKTTPVARDSYVGALCVFQRKRRMTIDCTLLFDSKVDEKSSADAVKYAENMVRMGLGIKSRHKDIEISPEMKRKMDRYFADNYLEGRQAESLRAELNDEKYQPLSKGFSSEEARTIEEDSRQAIDILVVDGEEMQQEEGLPENTVTEEPMAADESAVTDRQETEVDDMIAYGLGYIMNSDMEGFFSYAKELSMLPEALIEEINYFAFMQMGDIIIEEKDGVYTVIDEYGEEAEKWLKTKDN